MSKSRAMLQDYVLRLKTWYKLAKNNPEICVRISSLLLIVKHIVSVCRPILLSAKILKVLSVRMRFLCKRSSMRPQSSRRQYVLFSMKFESCAQV